MRYLHLIRNLSNWWLYLAVKWRLIKRDPLVFTTRSGVSVEVPLRLLQTFKEIFMEECYMRGMGRAIPPGPLVIDIGANAGFFSLFAASRFPEATLFAFEPIPSNFKQLQRNRQLNPACHITCRQEAVAGVSGSVSLSFDPDDAFTTSASIFGIARQELKTIQVPAVTLAEIFLFHGIERCDLLKMDCEGAEYDILYGCPADVLSRIDQMALEVHGGRDPRHNIQALDAYLNEQGFHTQQYPVGMLWAWR